MMPSNRSDKLERYVLRSDTHYHLAMELASQTLLSRLRAVHPRIVRDLTKRNPMRSKDDA